MRPGWTLLWPVAAVFFILAALVFAKYHNDKANAEFIRHATGGADLMANNPFRRAR